jgi:hypothetical protein
MNWLFQQIYGKRLNRETQRYIHNFANAAVIAAHKNGNALIDRLQSNGGPNVMIGRTSWGREVFLLLKEIVGTHGMITGSTGSGKTFMCLLIIWALLLLLPHLKHLGFGIVDASKSDLYEGTLYLLAKRLQALEQTDPKAADELRRRIVIINFSDKDLLSPFNILFPWPNCDLEYFASNRVALLLDLLPANDHISLAGVGLMEKIAQLLCELNLPIVPYFESILSDEILYRRLLAQCRNDKVKHYFKTSFPAIPQSTVAALRRRIGALFSAESIRLALSGTSAPDFRKLQDEGYIVLINCSGPNISRSLRRLLQCLVLSDVSQSVFSRQNKELQYLWMLDEAQSFLSVPNLRDSLSDLQSMARSYGTHFLYLTQDIATAVRDPHLLKILYTNLGWSFSMRGDPADCAFLKPVLPVTGRKVRPESDPFAENSFYSISEERSIALDSIASLPDRTGWLWLRRMSNKALKIKTRDLDIPTGKEFEMAVSCIRMDPSIGMRFSRNEYMRLNAERDGRHARESEPNDMNETFAKAYRRARGKKLS